ncbi:MAG: [citrate (pro-3S)-lyase] ligase [Acholeplasmataceae bacterium]
MIYRTIRIETEREYRLVKDLLQAEGLRFEEGVDYTVGILDQEELIATGSLQDNVLKMIAVRSDYRGENLTATVILDLMHELHKRGIDKYFLFTEPDGVRFFTDYSFSVVAETAAIALLENRIDTIEERLTRMAKEIEAKKESRAAIVMNCNPVTLGHLYLIERAAKENDDVIIFLVEEDRSVFPFEARYRLLKSVTSEIGNVTVLPSTEYIISNLTFPTYFLKRITDQSRIHMELDLTIFKKHFMPIFRIDYRYVGVEPLDPSTALYNETMKETLGASLRVIDRLTIDGSVVSASRVRRLARKKRFDEIKRIVPKATYDYLISEEGIELFR